MSTQLKKGFTLIELMVVIVIIGILAAIAIPKLFGMTAKAKAQEVGPAAGTWIKMHQAWFMEKGKVGDFDSIGYVPPGQLTGTSKNASTSTYFKYDGGNGTWQGQNAQGALGNGCDINEWNATLNYAGLSEGDTPALTDASTNPCKELTPNFKNLGKAGAAAGP